MPSLATTYGTVLHSGCVARGLRVRVSDCGCALGLHRGTGWIRRVLINVVAQAVQLVWIRKCKLASRFMTTLQWKRLSL